MNHEPHGPEMWPSGWRLRKACVGVAARAKAELVRTCKMLVAFSRFSMVQRAFSGLATCKMLRAFCRCSRASNDTGAPCNPIRGRAAGWCARSEEDTCSMLRVFSRSRGRNVPASASRCPIPRQCPITTATVPRGTYGPTRKSSGFAIWRPAMFRTGFV